VSRHTKPRVFAGEARRPRPPLALALTDDELSAVMDAAKSLDVEKRDLFLQRLSAEMKVHSGSLDVALTRALSGLLHGPVA